MARYKYRYTGRKNRAGFVIFALIIVLTFIVFLNYTYKNQPEFQFAVDQMMSIFKGENPKSVKDPSKPEGTKPVESNPDPLPLVPEPVPVPEKPVLIKGAEKGALLYVPYTFLQTELGIEDTVAAAKRLGAAGVLVDIKTTGGEIVCNLPSENPAIASAMSENPYDLTALSQRLANENLYLAGRVSAFKDVRAPRNLKAGFVAVASGVMFIDGANNRSLDPYKRPARDYVIDVALAAASLGVKEIFVADLAFPSIGQLHLVKYDDQGVSKPDAIVEFIGELQNALSVVNVKLTAEIPSKALYDSAYAEKSGQNFDYGKMPCDVAVSVLLSAMPKTVSIDGIEYVNDLSVDAYKSITSAIFSNRIFAQKKLVPIIETEKPATPETIAAQKEAAQKDKVVYWGIFEK